MPVRQRGVRIQVCLCACVVLQLETAIPAFPLLDWYLVENVGLIEKYFGLFPMIDGRGRTEYNSKFMICLVYHGISVLVIRNQIDKCNHTVHRLKTCT